MNLHKLYLRLFTKHNVRQQISTVFIFAVLIPVCLVGTIVYIYSRRQLIQSYEHLVESDALRVRSVLLTTTMPLYDTAQTFARDENLYALLTTKYDSDEDALSACSRFTKFQDTLEKNAALSRIQLYTQPDMLRGISDHNYFYPIDDEVKKNDWYQQAESNVGNFWRSNVYTDTRGNEYWELSYYYHITIPQTGSYAILVMTISDNHLRSLIKDSDFHVYVSVNEDPVFYSTVRSMAGCSFPIDIDFDSSHYSYTGTLEIEGSEAIASVLTLKPYRTDDRIYIVSADMNAMPHIQSVSTAFVLIMLFAVLIPVLIIYLFTGYFSNRIGTLRLAMHKVSNNDYEIVDSVQGDDELSATFTDLKSMVTKIKTAEAEIYEAQIKEQNFSNQQQQMELRLLANQINPHFLYNTLEMIRMKAFSEGNREVANAIKLLGKSMRYVLNNTTTTSTTLNKEMDYIVTYLSIQKMRFGSRLNYSIQTDEQMELSNYQILPLLIQPIVENAISHGIEETGEKGLIIIRIKKTEDDLLLIEVFDNGKGMSAEKLREVHANLSNLPEEPEHGIGLYNINNRIKLFYGEAYGMTIQSRAGDGTLVSLMLPLYNLLEEDS